MEIRELKTRDILPLARILSRLDLAGLAADMTRRGVSEISVLGLVDLLSKHIPEVGEDLFSFFGDLTGMTAGEFGELPLEELAKVVNHLARRPEVARFFGSTQQDKP